MRGKPNVARALADQRAIIRAIERRGPLNHIELTEVSPNKQRRFAALRALVEFGCIERDRGIGYRVYRLRHGNVGEERKNPQRSSDLCVDNHRDRVAADIGAIL